MKITFLIALPVIALLAVGIWRFGVPSNDKNAAAVRDTDAMVRQGDYLVKILDCNFCHTPFKMGPQGPEPDMSLMLSGHPSSLKMPAPPAIGQDGWTFIGAATNTAFAGPWGVSYSANLTPDETGLKGWTEDMFVRALQTGWHMGVENSRMIQPPMPWPAYGQATDEDLRSIFAYLQSIPPIENIPPAYQPPAAP